jgi:hypothetical protein
MAVRSAVTFATVKKIGLTLPGVEEGTAYGAPALKINGQLLACMATNKAAEANSLVLRVDFAQRDELIKAEPDVYYLKDHYVDYACVLVRLTRVHPDALPDLLRMAWRFMNSKASRKRSPRLSDGS